VSRCRLQVAGDDAGSSRDAIENRRRPRKLAPRAAAPFYYLKRTRRDGND
jgi:hypothetical protein